MRRRTGLLRTLPALLLTAAAAGAWAQPRILADGSVVRPTADGGTLLCSPDGTALQRDPDGTTTRWSAAERLVLEPDGSVRVEAAGPAVPNPCSGAATAATAGVDVATASATGDALERFTAFSYAHRMRAFRWQFWSSVIIFVTVLAIVATGLVLAVLQFRYAFAGARGPAATAGGEGATGAEVAAGTPTAPTAAASPAVGGDLDISAQGIKLSSPVLGVVILALSMAFLYLYLVFVYPIQILQG